MLRAFAGDNAADACNGERLLVDYAGHGIPVVVDRLTGVATFAATNPPPSPRMGNAISPTSRTYPRPTVAAHTLNLPDAIHNEPGQPASTEQFALSGHLPFHFGMSENQWGMGQVTSNLVRVEEPLRNCLWQNPQKNGQLT